MQRIPTRAALCATLLCTVMALPRIAGAQTADYEILPGDLLRVSVWREPDMQLEVLVRPDGKFSYPLVGEIDANGRTTAEVQQQIAEKIAVYYPDPVITVQVLQVVGNVVYVLGQVNRPGAYAMSRTLDVTQALALAGGTSTFAALNQIKILRRENGIQRAIEFRYGDIEDGQALEQNIILQAGDVVVVP